MESPRLLNFLSTAKGGDNALGSVCQSVCPSVCVRVWSKNDWFQSKMFVSVNLPAFADNSTDAVDRLLIHFKVLLCTLLVGLIFITFCPSVHRSRLDQKSDWEDFMIFFSWIARSLKILTVHVSSNSMIATTNCNSGVKSISRRPVCSLQHQVAFFFWCPSTGLARAKLYGWINRN